ncbi:type II secretion system protein GspM [Vibrio rumoiensis]|uniref:MSHA biogenesis protein MshJ n=1 Tax=Vibrio rumoiensis 1S-45 TaxID=1188252 RepID=A0A1E5E556_9VIBR|nr:type II secretion system protein GspM [Vibrio rumoiensis]OEF28477.1 MSHA biogenesis protein MshJ [Vibrio rumoiensis 1S-45]
MDGLKRNWTILCDRFAQLSEREKWLTTIAGWIAVIFLLFSFVIEPAQLENNTQKVRLASLQGQVGELHGQIAEMNRKLKQDPNAEIDKEYKALLQTSQDLSQRLSNVVDSLVTPTAMAALLEKVLDQTHKLKLVSLVSMPSEPITLENSSDNIGYYIHPVKIVLTGNYFDIEEYLSQLEQMSVKYYWRSFNYEVEEYPQAKLVLIVYTLGAKEEFIGG